MSKEDETKMKTEIAFLSIALEYAICEADELHYKLYKKRVETKQMDEARALIGWGKKAKT